MPLRDYWRESAGVARRRGRRRLRLQIGLTAGMLVVLMVAGLALYAKSRAAAVATDPDTLCPLDAPPAQVAVILLDVSDRFSEPQRLRIRNELVRLRDDIPRFGLVELYTVDRAGRRLTEPVAHLCNPGTDADVNKLYQNPELARRRWDAFAGRLEAEVEREISAASARTSPILEAIQAAALRTFARPEYDGVPKRLLIVSDLLHHVPGRLSMYDGLPSFEAFARSAYYSQVRGDLKGVSVSVYYLARSGTPVQGPAHLDFWKAYFLAQGAAVEHVETVFGDE